MENPYSPPQSPSTAVGVLSESREDLRNVATYQKGILVCILINLLALLSQFAIPVEYLPMVSVGILLVGLVGAVFVFLLAVKVYGVLLGIVLGLLSLIPLLGLLVLLIINGKATKVLKQNGIKVGLLGADRSAI